MDNLSHIYSNIVLQRINENTIEVPGELIKLASKLSSKKIQSKQDCINQNLEVGDTIFYDGNFYVITEFYKGGLYAIDSTGKTAIINARKVLKINPNQI